MSYNNANPAIIQRLAVVWKNKATQSINGWTQLTGWTEVQDPTNNGDPVTGIITVPRAGVYRATLADSLSQSTGNYVGLAIRKGTTTPMVNFLIASSNATYQYYDTTAEFDCVAGDTITLWAYCAAASNDNPSLSNSWATIVETPTVF